MLKKLDVKSVLKAEYEKYKKLIPDVDHGHLSYDFRKQLQKELDDKGDLIQFEEDSSFVEEQLKYSGCSPVEVNTLMDKFVSNLSYAEIAKKYGFVNKQQASRHVHKILDKLKDKKSLKLVLKSKDREF